MKYRIKATMFLVAATLIITLSAFQGISSDMPCECLGNNCSCILKDANCSIYATGVQYGCINRTKNFSVQIGCKNIEGNEVNCTQCECSRDGGMVDCTGAITKKCEEETSTPATETPHPPKDTGPTMVEIVPTTVIKKTSMTTAVAIETSTTKDTTMETLEAKPIIIGTVMGILTLFLLTIIIALLVIFMRYKIKVKNAGTPNSVQGPSTNTYTHQELSKEDPLYDEIEEKLEFGIASCEQVIHIKIPKPAAAKEPEEYEQAILQNSHSKCPADYEQVIHVQNSQSKPAECPAKDEQVVQNPVEADYEEPVDTKKPSENLKCDLSEDRTKDRVEKTNKVSNGGAPALTVSFVVDSDHDKLNTETEFNTELHDYATLKSM